MRCNSVLVWIEYFCGGHRHANRREAMQDTHGIRHRSENFVEPLIAIGGLVESTAAQFNSGAINP
jgi:hypothetical protein